MKDREIEDIVVYKKLTARVKFHDHLAAEWMELEAPKQRDFGYGDKLGRCFLWRRTPQGHDYWSKINKLING